MNKIVQFPDNTRVREEASYWLVSLEEGLTAEEKPQLAAWLSADPAHRTALIEQARLWDELDLLSELSGLYPLVLRGRIRAAGRNVRRACLAAAGVALAVFGGWLIALHWTELSTGREAQTDARTAHDVQPVAASWRQYRTTVGEQLGVRLPDGSTVFVNTDSILEVRYTGSERRVRLERGEAMFEVAHDAARPFTVDAGMRVLEALGTVFDVERAPAGDIELTVTEGRVRVLRSDRQKDVAADRVSGIATPLTVAHGQIASIGATEERIRTLSAADLEAQLAWRRGMLIFRGETLSVALAEVERYTPVRFVLRDASLGRVRVGGYFRTGDVDGVLLALEQSFGIETRRISDTEIELFLR